MSKARFHPAASEELREQARYYEMQVHGLGRRFLDAVEAAVTLTIAMPAAGSVYLHGTRRVFVRGFPHAVVYRQMGEAIVVFAIVAHRRLPGYWRHRRA